MNGGQAKALNQQSALGGLGERGPSKFLLLQLWHFGKQNWDLERARWRGVLKPGHVGKKDTKIVSNFYTYKEKNMAVFHLPELGNT